MGRLFWRFFWFFWLAQVATSLLVGVAVWALRPIPEAVVPAMMQPPPNPPSLFPLVMPIALGGVISLVFAGLMASYVTRPIRRLDQAFQAIADGRLEERIGEALGTSRTELTALGTGFDRMADRLQILVDSQRRLLHDVSHEMRAPLARFQVAIDLMERSPQRQTELRAQLHADINRLNHLVDELLTLARLEAGSASEQREQVLLHEILSAVAEDARFDAGLKQCEIVVDCPIDLELSAKPELLHRAIDNVARNAIRHAPAQSHILLSGRAVDRNIRIDVEDQGPGVAESELSKMFDPFVRGIATQGDGYGLGLAITRRAIETYGGSVVAVNRPEGGLRVSLKVPAS